MSRYFFLSIFILSLCLSSCTPEPIEIETENRFGQLPNELLYPADNMPSPEKIALGKNLFWDPILSGNKDVACVTCHHPNHGYAEQLDLSLGVGGAGLSKSRTNGTLVKRNSMTILNTAYNGINAEGKYSPADTKMFWDNRSKSLEEQAIQPILSMEEMRGSIISEDSIMETVIKRLENISAYNAQFSAAFGENSITEENIGKAIAAFERTLVSNRSRFDLYVEGEESALTPFEVRGMINFIEVGCVNCHNGPMFSDFDLHVLTVPENGKLNFPDDGDGDFAFRTPSLRNLKHTAPYMHNGVFSSLDEVLSFYDDVDGESQNPNVSSQNRDEKLMLLNLQDNKVESIIAFLNALNDENFDKDIPDSVPSQLSPGGDID